MLLKVSLKIVALRENNYRFSIEFAVLFHLKHIAMCVVLYPRITGEVSTVAQHLGIIAFVNLVIMLNRFNSTFAHASTKRIMSGIWYRFFNVTSVIPTMCLIVLSEATRLVSFKLSSEATFLVNAMSLFVSIRDWMEAWSDRTEITVAGGDVSRDGSWCRLRFVVEDNGDGSGAPNAEESSESSESEP